MLDSCSGRQQIRAFKVFMNHELAVSYFLSEIWTRPASDMYCMIPFHSDVYSIFFTPCRTERFGGKTWSSNCRRAVPTVSPFLDEIVLTRSGYCLKEVLNLTSFPKRGVFHNSPVHIIHSDALQVCQLSICRRCWLNWRFLHLASERYVVQRACGYTISRFRKCLRCWVLAIQFLFSTAVLQHTTFL